MSETGPVRAFQIPADVSELARARDEMATALGNAGWKREEAGRVLLAGSEAMANAIEHGSADEGFVEVSLEASDEELILRVRDDGRPGCETPRPITEEPPPSQTRGRGILIMNRLADSLDFKPRAPQGTEVVLGFSTPETEAQAPSQAA